MTTETHLIKALQENGEGPYIEPAIGRSLLTKVFGERRGNKISDVITLTTRRSVFGSVGHGLDSPPQQ